MNRNRIYKKISKTDFHTIYKYDYSNRLINESNVFDNGLVLSTSYSYDLRGNKISSTDVYENTTRYEYDAFNRLVKTIYPLECVEERAYDPLNNVTSKIDANGYQTLISCTARGKTANIVYPCGATESHIYNLQGEVEKSILPNGSYIIYSYDYKNRVTSKQIFNALGQLISNESWVYNAFQKLREIDNAGVVTEYFYDYSGKLIKTCKEDSEILYFYDTLGRKNEVWEKCKEGYYKKSISVYNALNQVIEERIEDTNGTLFSRKSYAYDVFANIINTTIHTNNGIVQKSIEYDCYQQPLKIIHPNGEVTHFFRDYNRHVKHEEEIDPLGNVIARTFDEVGNLAYEEYRSPIGKALRGVRYLYDADGNLINRLEENVETRFEYDSRGREIAIIEAAGSPEQKITRKEYDSMGNLSLILKPDGSVIKFIYDAFGRLTEQIDSKGCFHYQYVYDLADNILSVKNLVTNAITTRQYDKRNRMTSETLENGLILIYEYDGLDRVQKVTLPDTSTIDYTYDAKNLVKLSRYKGYTVEYKYDLSGKIEGVDLPFALGKIDYTHDNALRLKDINSPYFNLHIGYDPCNRLVKYESYDSQGYTTYNYAYDLLHQLTEEKGDVNHSYHYDSRFNRTQMDEIPFENNVLNQLISQNTTTYQYDLNGNLSSNSQEVECKYDTLDRLIEVIKGSTRIKFEYDAFHRRMSKQVFKDNETTIEKYIYITDSEVGSTDVHGNIKQLKIIGPGPLKNSAAIELNDQVFIPIHNHRGDIVTLLSSNGTPVETYRYSAYGEEKIFTNTESINPWRFSGKRVDKETGWSYFGRRYYDPEIGKWTGPDPIWFEDGTNLYAYVKNNPITYVDPNGLFGFSLTDVWNSPQFQGTCQIFTGAVEMGMGGYIALESFGFAAPVGFAVAAHGADHMAAGIQTIFRQTHTDTLTSQLFQKTGMSPQTANLIDNSLSIAGTMGGAATLRSAQATFFPQFQLPTYSTGCSATLISNEKEVLKLPYLSTPKNVFPKNPKDLLPDLPRDVKGRIYPCENMRIRPELHEFEPGSVYNQRHHSLHYHVEIRPNNNTGWTNDSVIKLKPNGYKIKDGTGFLPGEKFPGCY